MKSLRTHVGIVAVLTLALVVASCAGGGGGGPGGKIAFLSFRDGNREIYVMNPDGSDQVNLTNDDGDDFDPDWSADGKRIAFVSNRTGEAYIYVMDGDGTNQRQVGREGGSSPRWSRDGSKIAFSRAGSIAVMDADGSDLRVVLEWEREDTAVPCRAGSFPGGWSPDDGAIIYYSASISRQEGQVCTIKADGSDIEVVVSEPGVYNIEPIWSPDGRYIVYRAVTEGVHDIWVVDLEEGVRTNVTDNQDLDGEPAWSPDGEWIVFASIPAGEVNFDIYIMRKDGSDLRRLTEDPAKEAYPAWVP